MNPQQVKPLFHFHHLLFRHILSLPWMGVVLMIALSCPVQAREPLPNPGTGRVELRLEDNRVSLRAKEASLREVLEAFATYGVRVNMQSGVTATISGEIQDVPVDDALHELLGDLNYDILWREIPYGRGRVLALSGIRVYRDGAANDPMQSVPPGERRILTLETGERYVADEVLLGMRPGVSPEDFRALLRSMGGQVVAVDKQLGIYRIRLPANTNLPALLARLNREAGVAAVEPNFVYDLPGSKPTRTLSPESVTLRDLPPPAAGAPALAILDSGLAAEWLAEGALRASMDATNPQQRISDPVGHGTQMALIGSGRISPHGSGTPDGKAGVPIVAIRGFDEEGLSTSFGILESLRFSREQGAGVVSMSWGSYTRSEILNAGFQQAADADMILLAAAGNDGKTDPMYPAAYPGVLAVGAMRANGELWEGSNRGEHLDFVSYGSADFPIGSKGPPGAYAGTSIATPWVAAAITAYRAQYPQATSEQIIRALTESLSPHAEGVQGAGAGRFDEKARTRFLETSP
ncbi:MAG: S8 family serine peptidase [Kiritimatiellae bacterium]|nr:S8 family serine peptidase [Kiritimatiellia bacterium]